MPLGNVVSKGMTPIIGTKNHMIFLLVSLIILVVVPAMTASLTHLFYPSPAYETGKEFLQILLEISGVLFGIGGLFATFLIKNAFDARENLNRINLKDFAVEVHYQVRAQKREMRPLVNNVIIFTGFFFILSMLAIFFSFYDILKMSISSFDLGLNFGFIIASYLVLFLTFVYQNWGIDTILDVPLELFRS